VRTIRLLPSAIALVAGVTLGSLNAQAHPHVWVTVKTTVLYENGSIAGLEHAWTFDEAYTAMAIEGLDTNGDGKYDKQELAELAKVNIEGLQEFDYFTVAKLGDGNLNFQTPTDYWLDYSDKGILTLHFTLPLEHAVLGEAQGFTFSVFDPSFFIAFDLAEKDPVKLSAKAPAGCQAVVQKPAKAVDDLQNLGEAFYNELGSGNFGIDMAKTIAIDCTKS